MPFHKLYQAIPMYVVYNTDVGLDSAFGRPTSRARCSIVPALNLSFP